MSLLAARADAAEARYRLSIPPKPPADALIDLGLQANISVVGVSACGATGQVSLSGSFTLEEALRRLTDGAPCAWRVLDPRSVRIIAVTAAEAPREPIRPTTLVGEVMVTATKRPAQLGRVAAGLSVLPGSQIELTGATDVTDTIGQLAGVLATNLGPGRDKLLIRGISDGAFTGRARSTVSTYLDDAPINYNAPDPALRLVDIDRVEVLRGPQGALYGSGAMSGIYRIVTAKPELDRTGGGVAAFLSTTEGGSPSHELEAYGNLPFAGGRAAVRAVAYHEIQGGYLDNMSLRLSDVDETRRDGGRLALRLQPSDAWQIDVLATAQKLRTNDSQYTTADVGGEQRTNLVREAHKNDFVQGGVTLRGELDWASLTASFAYVHHTFGSQYDASTALENFNVDDDLGVYIERARVGMLVSDLVLRSPSAGRFTWLAGAYAAATEEKQPSSLASRNMYGPQLAVIYREDRKDRLREVALYGEGSWEIQPGWSASLGGRLFQSRVDTSAIVVARSPGTSRDFDEQRTFSGLSPKLSMQWQLASGDLVYGLISEGYRPGGFNSGGFLSIRPSRVTFAPDRLRNFEVGAKLRLFDRRLSLRGAAFYDEWDNIQTDQYRPSGLSYTANVGDAQILGLEGEAAYDFGFGLSLQGNLLLSQSDMTRINPDFTIRSSTEPPIPVLDELPGIPGASGGVLAVYERPLSGDLTLKLVGEASYVGRSALSFDASHPTRMGDFVRARLSAELASPHWSAQVYVSNPGDDAGDTFAYGNPFSFGQVRQVTPQRPRTIGLRLAAAF